jgi:nitrate reductase gamma subunit
MLYSFSMLFDWSTFFCMLLEHILFSMTPLSFCNNKRREISLNFGVFIFAGWMACFA